MLARMAKTGRAGGGMSKNDGNALTGNAVFPERKSFARRRRGGHEKQ